MPRAASARNLDALKIKEDITTSVSRAIKPLELPDIVTFAENEHFCGKKLYPRQRTLLRLMYADLDHMTNYDYDVIEQWRNDFYIGNDRIGCSPDIWERLNWLKENEYPHFAEIEFIGGRRGGKGHLGGIVGAYQAWKMITLDNPQWVYGIDLRKDLYSFITATNQSQARDYQFKDIAETISNAPCFEDYISTNKGLWLSLRTPADKRQIAELEKRKVTMDREVASLRFVALSSNSRAGRGAACFSLFFDEMAHMMTGTEGPQTAEEVYKALTPSLGQLGKDALIYIPTSPYCLAPGTKVLTDNLRWVGVETLKVGDGVVGFDEFQIQGNGRCWRKSKVTETQIIQAPTFEVKTTGPSVTSTGEHLWLAKRPYESTYRWMKTKDLKPGYEIGDIGTWEYDESRDAGYLAGFFDGEGHIPGNRKQGVYAGAAQNPGAVLNEVMRIMDEKEIDYWTTYKRKADVTVNLGIQGGIGPQMAFMGSIRPLRLMDKFMGRLEGTRIYGKKSKRATVLSVEEVGVQDVVALGTSTNTLMAEGLFSHNSKVGAAYSIYQDALKITEDGKPENPEMLMVQLPSWSPYEDWNNPKVVAVGTFRAAPMVLDDQALRLEERDLDAFKVEKRAQWAEVINAYLSPKMVDNMFKPIVTADGGTRVLENHTPGVMRWVYRGHADPSQSQANFAMAIGHTENFTTIEINDETGEEEPTTQAHVVFDWLHVWKPSNYEDHQLDYLQVEKELVEIIMQFRTLKNFSFDQYGGFVTVPYLKSHLRTNKHEARVHQSTATNKTNQLRAERFKSALGMGWIHAPKDELAPDGESLLEQELKFLQVKNGTVVKQDIGPVTTKDLADCVMEVSSELLSDQIDRVHRNRLLSGTRLATGAQGGYHTGMEMPPEPGSARDRLGQLSRDRFARRSYGV